MTTLTKKQINEKIKDYKNELSELTEQYNKVVKYAPGTPIHEDFASEVKYFKRKVLEGKIQLTEEIIQEYEEMLEK